MLKNILKDKAAVSSVVGITIMFAITLLSIGIMVLYTLPAIESMEDMAQAQKIEQGFTVFDSRTSKTALGEAPLQTTGLSLMGGDVEVLGNDETYDENRIMVVVLSSNTSWYNNFYQNHKYWDAWKSYENEPDFAGFNASMGKIVYTSGERIIAYEGGGVWSKYPTGGTVMISPPEFHFNGETLTIPIMKITGNTSVSGSTNAAISVASTSDPDILFPNSTKNSLFVNPLKADKIIIYIQSDYYDGWAEYAETLITTTATLDDENKTAILDLDTVPEMGTYPLAYNFKIVQLNESNPEPIYNFSYYLEAVSKDASNFNSIKKMTVTASAGTKHLEYKITKNYIEHIKYSDSSVGTGDDWEIWVQLKSNDPDYSEFPIVQEGNKVANCTYDLISDTYIMKYDSGADTEYSWANISSTTMVPNIAITAGNEQSLNTITQHYLRLMSQEGTIEGTWNIEMKNNKINFDDSSYTLLYDAGGTRVTYLYITTNELKATVN
ncbi:hypothetical protein V7O62_08100 [Methanolobus sp. ZRKC2]|uniref:DUF7289 family protein n=1 Tax=Methanolobus sp. ZRKC2 TaxID=3125783 RepID=UPI003246CEAC